MRALAILLLVLASGAARAESQSFDVIARGRALATAGDCVACHTAPLGTPYAGGLSVETPFGILVSPNITPDRTTGLGAWTDDEFVRAMQTGIGRHGEHLYPAFPYPYYTRVSRDDVLAIRAFLNTLPAVKNPVVTNQLPFPFDIRLSLSAWNTLYFNEGPFKPVVGKSDEWNRGAYLVEGLGHCGACHTAKTMLGGDNDGRRLMGGVIQDWFAPALTSHARSGLGAWSIDEVVEYLATGSNARAIASGPMAEVITDSTSRMDRNELRAIAVYLKDQPAGDAGAAAPLAASDPAMRVGAAVYLDNCAACHTGAGVGIPKLFPPLAGSASVQSAEPDSLLRVVLRGGRAAATDAAPTGPAMPSFAWRLDDRQVAAVVTYIRNSWGNAAPAVPADRASRARDRLARQGN